jgi:hypothetical protein
MNPLAGKPLRYLIGADDPPMGADDAIIEAGYDVTEPAGGWPIAFRNLFR